MSNNNNNNNNNNHISSDMSSIPTMRPTRTGNSFVTFCTYKEREETLKRTSLMADETCYRNKRDSVMVKQSNGTGNGTSTDALIPPPPPQFANVLPKQQQQQQQQQTHATTTTTNQIEKSTTQTKNTTTTKPPTSPVPDYDHVQLRSATNRSVGRPLTTTTTTTNGVGGSTGVGVERRATLRLGTVVIGEYEQQHQQQQQREPGKFGFIASERASKHENLQTELQNTLTRSNLRQRTFEHQSHCLLQQQQQRRDYENYEYNTNNNAEGSNELGSGIGAIARKLNGMSITNANLNAVNRQSSVHIVNGGTHNGSSGSGSGSGSGTGTGILKNGNGQRSNAGGSNGNSYAKSGAEKSIKFGN